MDISDQVAAGGEEASGGAVHFDASTPSPPVGEIQANQGEDISGETAAPTNLGDAGAAIPGFWQVADSDDEGLGDEDEGEWEDADDDSEEKDEEDDEEEDSGIVPPPVRDPLRGCQHYSRGCKLVAPCCGEVHWCRFCHNAKWEDAPDADKRHILDRYAQLHLTRACTIDDVLKHHHGWMWWAQISCLLPPPSVEGYYCIPNCFSLLPCVAPLTTTYVLSA